MTTNRIAQAQVIPFKREDNEIRYLMLKRNEAKGGFWQAVTGGIAAGETPAEGALRELEEELEIAGLPLIDLDYSFEFFSSLGRMLKEHVFAVDLTEKQEFTVSEEHTEYRWATLDEALGLVKYDSSKEALQRCETYLTNHTA